MKSSYPYPTVSRDSAALTRAMNIGAGLALLMIAETHVLWATEQRNPYLRPVFYALRLVPIAAGYVWWLAGGPDRVAKTDAVRAVLVMGALSGAGDIAAYALHAAQDARDTAAEEALRGPEA